MSECEQLQTLLRCYTHILTKESEKVVIKLADIKQYFDVVVESRKTISDEIRQWEKRMIDTIHTNAQQCINFLNKNTDLELTKLKSTEQELQTLLISMNEIRLKLNVLTIKTFTENNLEQKVAKIQNEIREELDKLSFPEQTEVTKFSFVPNVVPGQTLGKIRKCCLSLTDDERDNILNSSSVENKITFEKTVSSKIAGDLFHPVIGDITTLSSANVIVVCDWINRCMKAFYSSYHCRLCMGFKSHSLSDPEVDCIPWHVTAIDDSTVAVTTNHQQLLLVNVTSSLSLKCRIPVEEFYHGIRLINNTKLAVSYNKTKQLFIDVISLDGHVVHTIKTGIKGDVWKTSLAVSSANEILIGSSSGVTCISQEGHVLWFFSGSTRTNFIKPLSVSFHGSDSFITIDSSNRVVSINKVSSRTSVLLSRLSGIVQPTCVHVTSELLYISDWRTGKIYVTDINADKT